MTLCPAPVHRLSLDRIQESRAVIDPVFLTSPQFDCEPLSAALGCGLTLKLEFLNPIRSFKGRGASFLLAEALRRGERRPLVCASAGNWGQALAYVCRTHALPLTVYASVNANALKVERMRALGARVVLEGHDFDAAKEAARAEARAFGGWLLEDGLEPEISEGHGTIAVELLERGDQYDAVVIPLGNGALLTGMARWFRAHAPHTRVIGVCPVGASAMEQSWRTGALVQTARADTIADGLAVRMPIPEAVRDMDGLVDDVLLVSDADLKAAMRQLYREAGLLLEPAGASGVAAIAAQFAGQRVATVLCGSNLTPAQARTYLYD